MRVWLRIAATDRLTELGAAFRAHALDILTWMDSTRPSRFQPIDRARGRIHPSPHKIHLSSHKWLIFTIPACCSPYNKPADLRLPADEFRHSSPWKCKSAFVDRDFHASFYLRSGK